MSRRPPHHILLLLQKLLLLLLLPVLLLLLLLLLLRHHHIPHSVSAPCVALDVEWSWGQLDGELDGVGEPSWVWWALLFWNKDKFGEWKRYKWGALGVK